MNRLFYVVLSAFFLFLFGCALPQESELPVESSRVFPGTTYMVDASAVTADGEIWFTDENGNVWIWQLGESDAPVNDHVILVLADNNTPSDITDDIIVEWR